MSRRNPKENKSKLSEIINLYKAGKDQENALKKSNASMNEEIKAGMKDLGVTEFDTDLWTAKITTKTKESFDEEKAIEILKSEAPEVAKEVIRVKEYIDEDALEKAIYNHTFNVDIIAGCKIVGDPTITLTISKKKKED